MSDKKSTVIFHNLSLLFLLVLPLLQSKKLCYNIDNHNDKEGAIMLYTYHLTTPVTGFVPITAQVKGAVAESGIQSGICVVYCPHTTASITINENADPDVQRDLLLAYAEAFPDRKAFCHAEGNSAAHAKASALGSSATIIIEQGKLLLGTWQGIYFCEFDGVRNRTFYVKILADGVSSMPR